MNQLVRPPASQINPGGLRPARPRTVYFAFDPRADHAQAISVCQAWRFRRENVRFALGLFDPGAARRMLRGPKEAAQAMIRDDMAATAVTCVLASTHTAYNRWVRYQIAASVAQGNALLTVDISLMDGGADSDGPALDPLSTVGIYAANGKTWLAEEVEDRWVPYREFTRDVTIPRRWARPPNKGIIPLSNYARCRCYVRENGAMRLADWIADAAGRAG